MATPVFFINLRESELAKTIELLKNHANRRLCSLAAGFCQPQAGTINIRLSSDDLAAHDWEARLDDEISIVRKAGKALLIANDSIDFNRLRPLAIMASRLYSQAVWVIDKNLVGGLPAVLTTEEADRYIAAPAFSLDGINEQIQRMRAEQIGPVRLFKNILKLIEYLERYPDIHGSDLMHLLACCMRDALQLACKHADSLFDMINSKRDGTGRVVWYVNQIITKSEPNGIDAAKLFQTGGDFLRSSDEHTAYQHLRAVLELIGSLGFSADYICHKALLEGHK